MNDKIIVTRDAMLAGTINQLMTICLGNKDQKEFGRLGMRMTLEALKPTEIITDEDQGTALLITTYAKIIDDMELEAEMLSLLKPRLDHEVFKELTNIDYSKETKDEVFMYTVVDALIPFLLEAGLRDIETAFTELDYLKDEVEL